MTNPRSKTALAVVLLAILSGADTASAVSATLPDDAVIASAGQTTVVSVDIGSVVDLQAADVSITFDPAIVTVPDITSVQVGTLVSGCIAPAVNLTVPGHVTIALACPTSISGSGSLFMITFQGVANGVSALTFSATATIPDGCQLNEGNPSCEPGNGQITVGPAGTATATGTATSTPTAIVSHTPLPAPATLILRRARLRADTALRAGRDNGSLRLRGVVNTNPPFGGFVDDLQAAGLSLRVITAGGVDIAVTWPEASCHSRTTGRGPRITCEVDDASGRRWARFRPMQEPNLFEATVIARDLAFAPPLTADPIVATLTTHTFERHDDIGGCVVRGSQRHVEVCRETGIVTMPTPSVTVTPSMTSTATQTDTPSPAGPITRGRFVSTQVNVDSQGLNVAGDAANEPSIAVDPLDGNNVVIGWRQFPSVSSGLLRYAGWAYSHDGGVSWSPSGVLDSAVRSDPVLDADAEGNIYYYSLTGTFLPDMSIELFCDLFVSRDRGISWEPPVRAFGGDKPWMAVDRRSGQVGAGNIYTSWSSGEFTRSTDGGQTFMQPILLPEQPFFGTLAVGPDGEVYAVGISSVGLVVDKSTDAMDPNAAPTFVATPVDLGGEFVFGGVPNPSGLLGQPWIATDHSEFSTRGNVYLLQSADPPGADPLDVMFARSHDGGATWSPPIRINDDSTDAWQWFATMSVAPNGRIDVIWNDTRSDPTATFSEVYYSWSLDGGASWSSNEPVTPPFDHSLGYPAQSPIDPAGQRKLGDYYDMVSDDGGADLAYAATFNGEQDVYFVRLPADCNGNGVEDDCDIACGPPNGRCDVAGCGTSGDANGNVIPDECEPHS